MSKTWRALLVGALSAVTVLALPAIPAQAATPPLCSDMLDDDGDGLTDYPADPGCTSATDSSERGTIVCDNGVDDDLDGVADAPLDQGCAGPYDSNERTGTVCDDGVDNDGDRRTDWPVDTGCTSVTDSNEGGDCDATAGVVACPTTGSVVLDQVVPSVSVSPGAQHDVVGHVDAYRFVVQGGGTHTLPCVVLETDVTVNPCAQAGGTFVERRFSLLDATVEEQDAELTGQVARVRVCNATWKITVIGFGAEALPAYVIC